jgi:hypothetical protein
MVVKDVLCVVQLSKSLQLCLHDMHALFSPHLIVKYHVVVNGGVLVNIYLYFICSVLTIMY